MALINTLDDKLAEIKTCLSCVGFRIHTFRWLGLLAVVLYRFSIVERTNPQASTSFDLIVSIIRLKEKGDMDYPTRCDCDWIGYNHQWHTTDGWSFTERLLDHIDHVFSGYKENRPSYEAAALAEQEKKR
jgi:hypothetical protein